MLFCFRDDIVTRRESLQSKKLSLLLYHIFCLSKPLFRKIFCFPVSVLPRTADIRSRSKALCTFSPGILYLFLEVSVCCQEFCVHFFIVVNIITLFFKKSIRIFCIFCFFLFFYAYWALWRVWGTKYRCGERTKGVY